MLRFLIINSFSERQRSQDPEPGWYLVHFFRICHLIGGLGLRLCCQTYVERVVADDFDLSRKLWVCWLYLSLNSSSVLPMYSAFLFSVSIVALYITLLVQHLFSTGQCCLLRQLHVRSLFSWGFGCRTFLLCF